MSEIIIYTQDSCPPCTFVKNYLKDNDVAFTERNIKETTYCNELLEYDAFQTPFILIDGEPMYQVDMERLEAVVNAK
ncbi:glutaredoxin family protein [Staphylococcus massiliensis]|uniref:Glutaredoxin n=1 Tax=Staphylococcus massiliensis S46 TaxID=1229783 RepID=K9ANY1_9STAP|nr:glutaredoxin family protein [Staphylococcus massiliensis]EKU47741.1 glutaredoxin [Staphylococcus massiliensis S46]MCG3399767.1 glutaredoxin family protein [Staphylococcus massiliensis]MCG3401505.1 glutaredoxin family protein [Staphylococcus massiliensis]POA01602.1 glutaredoxin family protein [Staphylococcus massiliensis CCUG 55927]